MVLIALVIMFFVSAFEMLSTAGRYEDFWDLPSAELKNNGHYGGAIWYVYGSYAEYGTVNEYTDEIDSADYTYYIAEIYIEAIDESRLISVSLRDPDDIAMAEKNSMASYEEIEADPDSYILWVDGLAEPLSDELDGYLYETLIEIGMVENRQDYDEWVIPVNVRQVNNEANKTFVVVGAIALIGIGVIITVIIKKSKQKKAAGADDGTVYMELPPEIAAKVAENENKKAAADGFTSAPADMPSIPQPDNDSFFADLDHKKNKGNETSAPTYKASETLSRDLPAPAAPPSPFAGVNENAEMDELVLPEAGEILPETEPEFTHPAASAPTAPTAPPPTAPQISAEEYFNKDFISQ
jgi:hypothetical protein